uniref:PATJ crumbs cell polarity complex component n=1 Tax=Amphilophus citrinellus TaxID=61819 RepID=A0A3Q0R9N4_AMPCI
MPENILSSTERQQVLGALERLQAKLMQREEWTHSDTLGNLRETLQSPLFNHILTLQHSIKQLRSQVSLTELSLSCSKHHGSASSSGLDPWFGFVAKGRPTQLVSLTRPLSGGLGFSVVGLNPTGSSSRGVFIKHIQPGGIAHRDGRLQERDQILVINGSPLEPGISQQQALTLLQQPGETVEMVVARDTSSFLCSSLLQDQWGHVEEIELVNDGSGLGFGIVGGKTTGVVVRTLIRNGVADRDGRLRTGDHILRIGATPTTGLTSDQVVQVLQVCGSRVNMLIARDPQGQKSAVAPPPPPPASAPVSSLPPQTPELTPQLTQRRLSKPPASGVYLDGVSLQGLTNQEVQEVMKQMGQTVVLTLVRKKARTLERSLDKGRNTFLVRFSHLWLFLNILCCEKHSDVLRNSCSKCVCVYVCVATEAELRAKWEQALGPKYQVLVVNLDPIIEDDEELQKSSKLLPIHTLRLGVELDSFDGHHYISSVAPGGPVDRHGVLRPEDELLEVNDVQLYGKSRREVVSFLKEVPPPFTLVCCRHPINDLEPESESEPESEPLLLLMSECPVKN